MKSPARAVAHGHRARTFPDALYVLVSLAADEADPSTGEPSLRAWRIVGDAIFEVALEVG